MEAQLHDASIRGDTTALSRLLKEDPYLVDKAYIKFDGNGTNVLHIAAMLGHDKYFRAMLQVESSCLNYMCLARDRDGRNPLHVAAMGGQLNILKLVNDHDALIQASLQKADRGGTILHLCVQNNQLEALKLLLHIFPDPDFVAAKNEDGMTILHEAVYYNQNQRRRQIIMYLIDSVAYMVNLKNGNGKTVLDLLAQQPENDLESVSKKFLPRFSTSAFVMQLRNTDEDMKHLLIKAKAVRGRDVFFTQPKHGWEDWFNKRRDAMMVVASLIATMAFQAIISPPGGVWQDDVQEGPNAHRVGQSVMAQTHPNYYKQLICANTVAFVSSLSTTLLLVRRWSIHPMIYFGLLIWVMILSVGAIAVSYGISLVTIAPKTVRGNMSATGEIAIIAIMVCIVVLVAATREYWYFKRNYARALSVQWSR